MFFIGDVRYFLFRFCDSGKWRSLVRDITAKLEGSWLIRSEPYKETK